MAQANQAAQVAQVNQAAQVAQVKLKWTNWHEPTGPSEPTGPTDRAQVVQAAQVHLVDQVLVPDLQTLLKKFLTEVRITVQGDPGTVKTQVADADSKCRVSESYTLVR